MTKPRKKISQRAAMRMRQRLASLRDNPMREMIGGQVCTEALYSSNTAAWLTGVEVGGGIVIASVVAGGVRLTPFRRPDHG